MCPSFLSGAEMSKVGQSGSTMEAVELLLDERDERVQVGLALSSPMTRPACIRVELQQSHGCGAVSPRLFSYSQTAVQELVVGQLAQMLEERELELKNSLQGKLNTMFTDVRRLVSAPCTAPSE